MNSSLMVPISEFCQTGSGITPSRQRADYYGGAIPWVKSGELRESEIFQTEECVTDNALSETSLKLIPAGALLVAMYGATVGRVGLLGIQATTNQAVCHIVPDPKRADARYLFHAFQQKAQGLVRQGVGGAQPNISQGIIKDTRIYLPPLDEQKRIAAILDKADELRRLRQRAIDRVNELGQAIFNEMFGDLAKVPIISLGELVDEFRYGTSNKSADKGYPALRIPNIIGGVLNLDDIKLVPVESAELQRLRLKADDVLFVRTNGNPDYVGRCAIFDPDNTISAGYDRNNWIYASYLIRARLKETQLNSVFLCEFLSTLQGRRLLRERSKTSAGQFNINTEGLGSIPVPVPALEKQVGFALKFRQISLEKRLYLHSKAYFDKLFSSLQHRAFSSKLTCKDVERELAIAG